MTVRNLLQSIDRTPLGHDLGDLPVLAVVALLIVAGIVAPYFTALGKAHAKALARRRNSDQA